MYREAKSHSWFHLMQQLLQRFTSNEANAHNGPQKNNEAIQQTQLKKKDIDMGKPWLT